MGWASGSLVMEKVIHAVEKTSLDEEEKVCLYLKLIDAFEDADCDTLDECVGESDAFDSAMLSLGYGNDGLIDEDEYADE